MIQLLIPQQYNRKCESLVGLQATHLKSHRECILSAQEVFVNAKEKTSQQNKNKQKN